MPEPDDDRAGATELVWSESEEQFFADGTIDASTGDVIDWYTLTLPADGPRRFTVYVQGTGKTGRLPVAVDVFDADVQQIGRIAVESETTSQVAYGGGVPRAVGAAGGDCCDREGSGGGGGMGGGGGGGVERAGS